MTAAEDEIFDRLKDRVAREEIAPIVEERRDALVEEHRERPFGPHSDALYRVLAHLRRDTPEETRVIVMTNPHEEWTLARLSGEENEPPELTGPRFDTQEEAEHAIFLERLERFEERYL